MGLTASAIQFGLQYVSLIPQIVQAGVSLVDAFETGSAKMKQLAAENRDPTQAEWDALDAAIDGKLAELNAK